MIVGETVIVEGKSDERAVKRAFEPHCKINCITTSGWGLNEKIENDICFAYKTCGIIILTDPDYAGEKIRSKLTSLFPLAKHAFISAEDALNGDDVGVENAGSEIIREALRKARLTKIHPVNEYSEADLYNKGLSGQPDSAYKRNLLGSILGIGYANAKIFLKRLNTFDINRQDWENALVALEDNLNE